MLSLAGLSAGAALIHAAVIAEHFREYWLFGLFFAVAGPLQLLWAWLVSRPNPGRDLIAIGGLGNLAIAAVWVISRTVGLPVGPDAWEPEAVRFPDLVSTLDEVGIAAIVAVQLLHWDDEREPGWTLGMAWVLLGLSVVGASLAVSPGH